MDPINSLLDATVKQRRMGSHAIHALAARVVKAYLNQDVRIDRNGEAWLIAQLAAHGPFNAVDVGANVGEWSEQILLHSNANKLYSYEAVPSTFNLLKKTITDQRAELMNMALSDTSGTLKMQEFANTPELASLHADYSSQADIATIDITAATGDEEMARLGLEHIDLLKVDTEGHDHAVLLGYRSAIDRGAIDVIQFEYNYTTLIAGKSLKMFFDFLGKKYLLCRLLPGALEACGYHPSLDDFSQANWVAVRKDIIDADFARQFALQPARGLVFRNLQQELAGEAELLALIQR